MVQVIRAIVQDGALWPLEPLRADTGSWVRVVVSSSETASEPGVGAAERMRLLEEMASLFAWDPLLRDSEPPTLDW